MLHLLLLTGLAWAQVVPVQGPPLTRIREFLELTDVQIDGLNANLRAYSEARAGRARRVDELRRDLNAEVARPGSDPAVLGALAVERETVCREDRQSYAGLGEGAAALLTPAQRTRLRTLEDATKLRAEMQEAQALGLLDRGPVVGITGGTPFLPGCNSPSIAVFLPGSGTPSFAAKQYLNLSDAQHRVLTENARSASIQMTPAQRRASELYQAITLQFGQEVLDPVALGTLYADLAGVCQAIDGVFRELRRSAESMLDPAQKTRLESLRAAQEMAPLIAEAATLGLVPPTSGSIGFTIFDPLMGFPVGLGCSIP